MPYNTEEIRLAYKSKNNFKRKNQITLLVITDGTKWHYLSVKKLSALLRKITSKYDKNFYCLNCFHSFNTQEKLKKHEKVYKDHNYCYVEMPNEDYKILKYNHGEKLMKVPFVIYAYLECLLWTHIKTTLKNLMQKINIYAYSFCLFVVCTIFF